MTKDELVRVAHAWDQAMIGNDPDAIGAFMGDDWVIIGSDGRASDKALFLDQVRSGALTHDVMTSEDVTVRPYGDAAAVMSRGVSGGLSARGTSSVFNHMRRMYSAVAPILLGD